ncbi:MAG: tetraacyldisaccharide 4'-kinase [Henriciella sp.]
MRPPYFWNADLDPRSREAAPLTRLILTPFASLYAAVTARRIRKTIPEKTDACVICIGNLTVGGVGKSPVVAALRLRLMEQTDLRIATLSRGYKAQLSGPLKVDLKQHTASDVGDEPFMLAQTGESWIGKDRAAAGKAMAADGVNVIIMDDGHQNPGLHKDLSLIVVDAVSQFGNGHVIPKGPLREPIAVGLARTDAIILMNDGPIPEEIDQTVLPIIKARLKPTSSPPQQPYIAFAGIGRPEKFFDTLRACGADLIDSIPFSDHHAYTDADMTYLRKLAKENAATLITTEKDYVRLSDKDRTDVLFLPVSAQFENIELLKRLLTETMDKRPK